MACCHASQEEWAVVCSVVEAMMTTSIVDIVFPVNWSRQVISLAFVSRKP